MGVGGGLEIVRGVEQDLLEGDAAGEVDPEGELLDVGSDGGIFGDEFQLFDLGAVEGFGAEVGDVPGLGEVFAAAAEAEREIGLDAGLGDGVKAAGAGVEDAEGAGFKLDRAALGTGV